MPDPRSAMKEFRFLERKRAELGLTLDEEYRLAELRDLVGPELEAAGRPGGGFDVTAAAARLRESLRPGPGAGLPAGAGEEADADALLDSVLLRGEGGVHGGWEPGASSAAVEPNTSDPPWSAAAAPLDPTATYVVPGPSWEADPFADAGAAPPDAGAPFAAAEPGWGPDLCAEPGTPLDPDARYAESDPTWDPDAYAEPGAPLDPGAPYTESEPTWDPNACAEPGAAALEPGAPYTESEPAWDPSAYGEPGAALLEPGAPYTEGEPTWDPHAYAEPGAAPLDPGAPYAENEPPWDPDAYGEPGAALLEPGAPYTEDEPAWGPSAHAHPPAAPLDPGAPYTENEPAWDPNAYAEPGASLLDSGALEVAAEPAWDPNAHAGTAAAPLDTSVAEPAWNPDGWGDPREPGEALPAVPLALEDDVEQLDASSAPDAWAEAGSEPAVATYGALRVDLALEDDPAAEPLAPPAAGDAAESPEGWDVAPAQPAAPHEVVLGEYDELSPGAPGVRDVPDALELLAEEPTPGAGAEPAELALGEYDDTSGFDAPAGAFARAGAGGEGEPGEDAPAAAVPGDRAPSLDDVFELGVAPAPQAPGAPGSGQDALQLDGALELGFQLESGGSFEAAADATVPDWARSREPAAWEAAPTAPATRGDEHGVDDMGEPVDGPVLDLEDVGAVLDVAGPDAGMEGQAAPMELAALTEAIQERPPSASAPALHLTAPHDPLPPWAAGGDAVDAAPDLAPEPAPPSDPFAMRDGEPAQSAESLTVGDSAPAPLLDLFTPGDREPAQPADPVTLRDGEPTLAGLEPIDLGAPWPASSETDPAPRPADDLAAGAGPLDEFEPDDGPPAPASAAELDLPVGSDFLEGDVLLDDLPVLEGELLEEIPADELVPLPEETPEDAPATPAWSAALAEREPPGTSPAALADPAEPDRAAAPGLAEDAGERRVAGAHRVVLHTAEGQARRGLLQDPDLEGEVLELLPFDGGPAEGVATADVKAVFFMLAPGEPSPAPAGERVQVTFRDGRQVSGLSPDCSEGGVGFFLFPLEPRANTARIWVYRSAVKQLVMG